MPILHIICAIKKQSFMNLVYQTRTRCRFSPLVWTPTKLSFSGSGKKMIYICFISVSRIGYYQNVAAVWLAWYGMECGFAEHTYIMYESDWENVLRVLEQNYHFEKIYEGKKKSLLLCKNRYVILELCTINECHGRWYEIGWLQFANSFSSANIWNPDSDIRPVEHTNRDRTVCNVMNIIWLSLFLYVRRAVGWWCDGKFVNYSIEDIFIIWWRWTKCEANG